MRFSLAFRRNRLSRVDDLIGDRFSPVIKTKIWLLDLALRSRERQIDDLGLSFKPGSFLDLEDAEKSFFAGIGNPALFRRGPGPFRFSFFRVFF